MLDKAILIAAQAHLGQKDKIGRALYFASFKNDASFPLRNRNDRGGFTRCRRR